MKGSNLISLILIFFLINCSTDESTGFDCIKSKLIKLDMVEYTGQEVDCKFFLELYHFKNKQYFLLGNHCADIIAYPTDCDGNKLCENEQNSECRQFYENANRIGIIGIEK